MAMGRDLNLGLIGNCSFSALVNNRGCIVWSCMPRFDADPIFCSLLRKSDDLGFFDILLDRFSHSTQQYERNSAVLITCLHDDAGNVVEVTDMAPRFQRFERTFRPVMIMRQVKAIKGRPRIRLRLRPTFGYGWGSPEKTRGSNHVRFLLPTFTLRLTTNAPVSYVIDEVPFLVEENIYLIIMPDESLSASAAEVFHEFHAKTLEYWRSFVRSLSIPFEWQSDVIRAAITLKLSTYEETGAIVATHTTSIPDSPSDYQTVDNRYCFLRDAYFDVTTLNQLGVTNMMEGLLSYLNNIVAGFDSAGSGRLQPVYGLSLETKLHEKAVHRLAGYRGMPPVRVGNKAWQYIQHDALGAMVLASVHVFFDERLERPGDTYLYERLEKLGEMAESMFEKPDQSPWVNEDIDAAPDSLHTFSAVMCWAACDRLGKIAARMGRADRAKRWTNAAQHMKARILDFAWDESKNSFVSSSRGELCADVLLLPELGFLAVTDPKFLSTLSLVEKRLRHGSFVAMHDPIQKREAKAISIAVLPETPVKCSVTATLWFVQRMAEIGRVAEARELFEAVLKCRNNLGLLSDDISVSAAGVELWGNFPQTIAMVSLVKTSIALSKPWHTAF